MFDFVTKTMVKNARMETTKKAVAAKKGLPAPKKEKEAPAKDEGPSSDDSSVSSDSDSDSESDTSSSSDSSLSSGSVRVTKADIRGYEKVGASRKQAKELAQANVASIRRHLSDSAKKSAKKEKKRAGSRHNFFLPKKEIIARDIQTHRISHIKPKKCKKLYNIKNFDQKNILQSAYLLCIAKHACF